MATKNIQRPTWAEINLDNLAFNYRSSRSFIGDEIKVMAVVKANAYGHGAIECARRLEREGVDWFGVALPEEGVELRDAGIKTPILCLGSFWAGQEDIILDNNLTSVVYQIEKAKYLNDAARSRGVTADIHVKVDTGMGRIGVRFDEVEAFSVQLKEMANLHVDGVMTHFAAADDLGQNAYTELQIKRFHNAVDILKKDGFAPTYLDLANSPGAVVHPEARGNMVRLGGILYGLGDDVLPRKVEKPELKPVMSLRTQISHLKNVPKGETIGYGRTFETSSDSLLATIPIGYQDGYRRVLSNRASVIVNGKYARVIGRISMDWTVIDVSDVPGVKIDDDVILIGEKGNLAITAEELAIATGTISYEITCGISRRVERRYLGAV